MTVVDLYTIQIIEAETESGILFGHELDEIMAETEQNITDLLPIGFRARIRRWDHPDPEDEAEGKYGDWRDNSTDYGL